jgi:Arc/MetJ-type ribon-helix-helix transcriptional regulator
MEVPLTPDLKKIVIEKVTSRIYGSATEVIKEGLKLLKERDELGQSQVVGKEGLVPEQVIEEPQHKCQDVRPLGQERGLFTIPEDFNAPLSREFWLKYYTLSCA